MAAAFGGALLVSGGAGAQVVRTLPRDGASLQPPAPVPYGPGETLEYRVKLGAVTAGQGSMSVLGIDTVRGHAAYHVQLNIDGGVLFLQVHDTLQSWIDIHTLSSHRFRQDQKEVRYRRHRQLEFYWDEMRWERSDGKDSGTLASSEPLDDVSFVYFVRTLPLEPGRKYRFDRYFKEDGNPVILEVLRREKVKVPAGTFQTVVVRPIIQTDGLFSKGGEAEIYFTDDDRKLLVQMRSKVPLIGSLTLELRRFESGSPLADSWPRGAGSQDRLWP
ncbi:MAG: DUF3108 domain-containing protein [Gemmatimonadetes bacterium]|nr:DUF3108 domain-containing protein [Gemmatimonadota bacterium]